MFHKKYLKLYKIDSNLVDYEISVLENYINYTRENDADDFYLSFNMSNFRSLQIATMINMNIYYQK